MDEAPPELTIFELRDGRYALVAEAHEPFVADRPFTVSIVPFGNTLERYLAGWRGHDSTLRPPPASLPGLSAAADAAMTGQYWLSANVLKADEDKTYPGAFVASPTGAGKPDRLPVITGSSGRERIYDGYPDVALDMIGSRTFDGRIHCSSTFRRFSLGRRAPAGSASD